MPLNLSKGNMYDFVTHTWNTVKGECWHNCSYCYMKRWGGLKPARFDKKELKTDLGQDNFIFVGSSNDLFSENIPMEWILYTIRKCLLSPGNKYLFQTKNPDRILQLDALLPEQSVICTTIETNRYYPDIMGRSPRPIDRAKAMFLLSENYKTYVTIEPILDFDLEAFVGLIRTCNPDQVNIGADSGNNGLPEPSIDKIVALIAALNKFTTVAKKRNLSRLLKC